VKNKIYVSLFLIFFSTAYAAEGDKHLIVEDVVYKITSKGGAEKVLFKKHAGIYRLKSDSQDYNEIKNVLDASRETGASVRLNVDPSTLEIKSIVK
jgi:hypothetical protein